MEQFLSVVKDDLLGWSDSEFQLVNTLENAVKAGDIATATHLWVGTAVDTPSLHHVQMLRHWLELDREEIVDIHDIDSLVKYLKYIGKSPVDALKVFYAKGMTLTDDEVQHIMQSFYE